MSFKAYVGNLDYEVTDEDLGQHFAQAGQVVSAVVIKDRQSGRSKGFGFVEFGSQKELDEAIKLNGTNLKDRPLVVNPARPQQPREFSGSQGPIRSHR